MAPERRGRLSQWQRQVIMLAAVFILIAYCLPWVRIAHSQLPGYAISGNLTDILWKAGPIDTPSFTGIGDTKSLVCLDEQTHLTSFLQTIPVAASVIICAALLRARRLGLMALIAAAVTLGVLAFCLLPFFRLETGEFLPTFRFLRYGFYSCATGAVVMACTALIPTRPGAA